MRMPCSFSAPLLFVRKIRPLLVSRAACTIALGLFLLFAFAQTGFAQSASVSDPPLTFGNNFFVTGDYVVAGANMSVNIANGFATGTITIPDANPGIQPGKTSTCTINGKTKTNCVPAGADILDAELYWQTVEKLGVTPGQPGSGQNGFFGPVFNGVPQFYPIAGATSSQNTVSFSNGGCTGGSTGKVVRTYRADVRGYLPQDASGSILANGTFQVMLPSSTNTTPITLGATLVIIYRVLSPNVPLNSIVIYDGAFAPGGTLLNMTQTVQGFYDVANAPVSRLTHIVGSTHSNKFQTVSLDGVQLPSLYPGLPPFPGFYGPWDNPTWTFPDKHGNNPVSAGTASATTMVAPTTSQGGCPSWGAVIFSTTVQNTDNDGLLDVWKTNQGYCDASINEGSCTMGNSSTGWVDLSGAVKGEKDVFVQLDYMCSIVNPDGTCNTTTNSLTAASAASGGSTTYTGTFSPTFPANSTIYITGFMNSGNNGQFTVVSNTSATLVVNNPNGVAEITNAGIAFLYSFNPSLPANAQPFAGWTVDPADGKNAVQKVVDAFASSATHAPVTLHVIPTHALQEQTCQDIPGPPLQLCPFPNQPGVAGWPGGLLFFENQLVDPSGNICTTSPPAANCVPLFQRGKRHSWHHALFAHALGLPNWAFLGGTLTTGPPPCPPAAPCVVQTSNTVTFNTSHGHGLVASDHVHGNGRVTVAFATSNPNLNGTYFVTSVTCPKNPNPLVSDCDVSNTAPGPYTFQIQIGTSVSTTTAYTQQTDPNLVVASGQADEVSGFSDIGGAHSLITLGNWKPKHQTWQTKAGTFMHELGHSIGLTHGGFYFDNLTSTNNNYTPTVEANCKSNHQSLMNYMFQIDLLDKNTGAVDQNGNPVLVSVVDYSGQDLDQLNKLTSQSNPFSILPTYYDTSWHGTNTQLGIPPGSPLTVQCDGTLVTNGAQIYRVTRATSLLSWVADQDINFDGNTSTEPPLRGHDDWNGFPLNGLVTAPGIDMRQIGATGSLSVAGLLGAYGGGLIPPLGGGGGLIPPLGGGGGLVPAQGGGGGLVPAQGGGGGLIPPLGGGGGVPTPAGLGGGGGLVPAQGGGGGLGEITQKIADSYTRPPQHLTASEEASPRFIDLSWMAPNFSDAGAYRIFRSADGGANFSLIATVPGTQLTFKDTVTCNPIGYQYYVRAVLAGTFASFPPGPNEGQESVPSNTVTTGQNMELLTACYTPPVFSLPVPGSSPRQGSTVTVTWTVQDASNKSGTFANNPGSNSLVAIGPISNDVVCVPGAVTGSTPRSPIAPAGSGIAFNPVNNQFTFPWNTALGFVGSQALNLPPGPFPPGCYLLELDLDSGQPTTSGNLPASAFQVQFFLSDVNESVLVTTTSPLPDAIVGVPYAQTLQEIGGVVPLNWTVSSGSLPPGTPGSLTIAANGVVSGTPSTAGTYNFTAQVTDSIGDFGTKPLTLTVHIFVSDSQPPANPPFTPTTTLPNAVVGSAYSNTVYESGGVSNGSTPFTWTIVSGSLTLNGSPAPDGSLGISFQPNTVAGGNNGTLAGTPTAPGTYTFTVKVTDSVGNLGTQGLTLRVADALFGDLIVVDGSPSANPLSGTLFRITPDGTISTTIASISNGSPTGVAVDPNTGNIFVAVARGTPRIVEVTRFGAVSDFVPGGVLTNPVAVAVDNPGNVYVGDNSTDKIYKFNSAGTQVDANGNPTANPFASLPASPSDLQDIRMTFDSAGNLIIASDTIGDVGGVVEVDKITPTGAFSPLYNTFTNSMLTDALTAASAASSGNTTYTGTFSPILPAGSMVTISGFTTNATNNGTFTIVSCTSTQLVVNNPSGIAETNPATATFNPSGLNLAIGTVGGIAVLADGSIDVADFAAKSVFNIANPGTPSIAITTAISGAATLCCNISGMANPPSRVNTTLFVTLNGVGGPPTRLQLAVPETNSVTTVHSGMPLTFANDVTWFQPRVTYFVDGFGNFGTLDLTTGVTNVIGTGTVPNNTGLDLTPTGQVYEYNISNQLIQVNPTTGAATLVGSGTLPNPGFTTTGGLTNGSYFGIDAVSGNLYSINLATGATTFVGLTTTAKRPSGCGFETSLAGSANVLYYTIGFGGRNCTAPMNDTLYQVDSTTGTTTTIGQVSVNGFVGSAFVGGTLYGFTFGGREYSINPATGVATFLTNTTAAVFGAASH